jgi:UDP-3-O-[3-hydroxymyristoyl] glucosamine N-acyltransferase
VSRPPATAAELAALVGGRLEGCAVAPVRGMNSIDEAGPDEATFITSDRYANRWADSRAGVAVIDEKLPLEVGDPQRRALIRVRNADLALASALEAFAPAPELPPLGVHPTAVVDASATLGAEVRIGARAVVGPRARIGDRCVVHPGAVIGHDTELGEGCVLHPNAVIRERCRLGRGVTVNACAVIGGEGFGYRPSADGRSLVRIPHLGTVVLEDGVEIGAATCVDRAKFGATVVGAHSKIDNLCQIAHNCRIGRMTVIAGLTGLAGSVQVGDGVQIGGNTGIADHRTVGSGSRLAAKSGVMDDVPPGATWGGFPAQDILAELRVVAAIRKLPEWSRKFRRLIEDRGKAP